MAPQNFISPVGGIHIGQTFENRDAPVNGAISSETAGFFVVLTGFVVAFVAAFLVM
jgi:hypothetical protein